MKHMGVWSHASSGSNVHEVAPFGAFDVPRLRHESRILLRVRHNWCPHQSAVAGRICRLEPAASQIWENLSALWSRPVSSGTRTQILNLQSGILERIPFWGNERQLQKSTFNILHLTKSGLRKLGPMLSDLNLISNLLFQIQGMWCLFTFET